MYPQLYIVDYPRKTAKYAEAYPIDCNLDYDKTMRCPLCGHYVSSAYWTSPREVVLTSRKVPDFLYDYSGSSPFVISDRAVQVLKEAGITGIVNAEEIDHVRFQRKSKKEDVIPRYFYIDLARSRITINHEKSVIRYGRSKYEYTCELCRQIPYTYDFTRHLSFNMDVYEGYDIFQIYEMGNAVFVSQRFMDVCNENHLTNLHVTAAENYGQWAAAYFLDGDEDA